MVQGSDRELVGAWRTAASDAGVCSRLEAIYADVAAAVAEREPLCTASGRCCRFEAYGHRLYVTGLEAAYTVTRAAAGQADSGARPAVAGDRVLSLAVVQGARARGDCPYLAGTLCTVHTIKPLACRTYYCDPTAREWQQDLTERMLARLRRLHDDCSIPYRYAEWRTLLAMLAPG